MAQDGLTELLQKKQLLYEKLLAYSRQQAVLSYSENSSEYQSLVDLKGQCIEAISKNEIMLKAAIGQDPDGTSQALYETVSQSLRQILVEIQKLHRESQLALQREMQLVQRKIATVRLGKKGTAGYNAIQKKYAATGVFTDKRC